MNVCSQFTQTLWTARLRTHIRSTTVRMIKDCFTPIPKNAGPDAPVPSLVYDVEMGRMSRRRGRTHPRTFMLAENQTKNIWKSFVSVRDSSGIGSILHCSCKYKPSSGGLSDSPGRFNPILLEGAGECLQSGRRQTFISCEAGH